MNTRWVSKWILPVPLLLLLLAPVAFASVEVDIQGVSGEVLDNVRASLTIATRSADEPLSEERVRAMHDRAESQIRVALEPFGYYRPQIDAGLEKKGETWLARYDIDAGEAIPVVELDILVLGHGGSEAESSAAREAFPLQVGQPLVHTAYEAGKADLRDGFVARGFLDAAFTKRRVEVDAEAYTARVVLRLDTGPLYRVGEISFEQGLFAEEFLERYLVLAPGEVFQLARLTEQRIALSKSGYFREVRITQGQPGAGPEPAIPLYISLEPFKANRYRGRVGWGTDTGFGVQLDWTRRYLGRHGHRLNAGITAVEERDRLAADIDYTIPLDPVSGRAMSITARHESKDLTFEDVDLPEGGETRIATDLAYVSFTPGSRQWRGFDLKTSAGLGLVTEDYDVFEVLFGNRPQDEQDAVIEAIGPEAYDTLSPDFEAITLGFKVAVRRTDDPLYIRRGDYASLEILGTDEALGSNITFWQARVETWNIWPVRETDRLLFRTRLGYTDADSEEVFGVTFNQMPEYYEFRTGGARSVRGYGFEEIFPGDSITGARSQIVASLEYEYEIIPDISAAVFLDAGDAFNDFDDFNERAGAGIGLRWRSPVGLARIDLGIPLNDSDDSFQIYITVGPEF